MHYRDNWKGTPYKAQLVTQDKATALLYKRFLDEFGRLGAQRALMAERLRGLRIPAPLEEAVAHSGFERLPHDRRFAPYGVPVIWV